MRDLPEWNGLFSKEVLEEMRNLGRAEPNFVDRLRSSGAPLASVPPLLDFLVAREEVCAAWPKFTCGGDRIE